MSDETNPSNERRSRRGSCPEEAVHYQLQRVVEGLSLEAMVLADDLGRVLARAGDPGLAGLLAGAAMWSTTGVDSLTMEQVRYRFPAIEPEDVVAEGVDIPDASGARLIAAGKTIGLRVAVDHAISGIVRICSSSKSTPGSIWSIDRAATAS